MFLSTLSRSTRPCTVEIGMIECWATSRLDCLCCRFCSSSWHHVVADIGLVGTRASLAVYAKKSVMHGSATNSRLSSCVQGIIGVFSSESKYFRKLQLDWHIHLQASQHSHICDRNFESYCCAYWMHEVVANYNKIIFKWILLYCL